MTYLLSDLRDIDDPYAIFVGQPNSKHTVPWIGTLEQRILQAYASPEDEDKNPEQAAWFIAGRSDGTLGRWEYGDVYRDELLDTMYLKYASPEFMKTYRKHPLKLVFDTVPTDSMLACVSLFDAVTPNA